MRHALYLVAAIALSAPAVAQVTRPLPGAPPPVTSQPPATSTADDFAKIDADASGALSLGEIKIVDSAVTQADFDKYDADHNQALSKTEFMKWQSAKAMKPAAPTPG